MSKQLNILSFLAACIAVFAAFSAASAATITTVKTSGGSGADSYVQLFNGVDGGNFGATTTMLTKNAISGGSRLFRKGYMRFDITSLPAGELITSATLQLTVDGTDSTGLTFSIFGLDNGDPGESWGEGTINYANAPANSSVATNDNSILGNAPLLGSINGATSGTNVTMSGASLVNFLTADTDDLVTFIITRDFEDPNFGGPIHSFRTKEFADTLDAFAPTLLITTVLPIPEPSTFVLLGGMLLLAPSVRRRRQSK